MRWAFPAAAHTSGACGEGVIFFGSTYAKASQTVFRKPSSGDVMIFDRIVAVAQPGTIIPKPRAKTQVVKGLGVRRGESALIYLVPNIKNPRKPHQKGINILEFEKAYQQLLNSGEFTAQWFGDNLPECCNEGWCNFTTIGGLFCLLGEAKYVEPGMYQRTR
jgi:hypothetical protein